MTNWQSYSPTLFAQAPHLPACGRNTKAPRTWVDIYDASSGHRIYEYCALSKPEDLRKMSFAVRSGEQAPSQIYVRMTDRQTRRVVTSDTVEIPPISQVTTRYTAAEHVKKMSTSMCGASTPPADAWATPCQRDRDSTSETYLGTFGPSRRGSGRGYLPRVRWRSALARVEG